MNTNLPKWSKWIISLAVVGLIGGGAVYFVQKEVEKQVRAGLEDAAHRNNATLTIKDVRYNLLKNVLTIDDAKAGFSLNGQPLTYAIEQIAVINPNRSLVLAFAQQKLDDVRGIQPAIDTVEVRNMVTGPTAVTTVSLQRIDGISLNMDIVREFLTLQNPAGVDFALTAAEALAYKSRTVSGMTSKVDESGISVSATIAGAMEKDYANLALDSLTLSDIVINIQQKTTKSTFTLKKMGMERMTLSREFFKAALTSATMSEEDATELLKNLFLGERPFIGSLTLDDMQLVMPQLSVPVKSFRYENSSTSPFAVRLDLKGLTLPTSALLSGPALMLVADMPTLTYNTSLNVLVPYKDPKALTKVAAQSSIDKLGSLELEMDSLVNFSLSKAMKSIDDSRLARLKVIFTDDGLTPRAVRMSQATLGADITKLGALGTELVWNAIPQAQRTPQTRQLLEKFMVFLQKPGSLDITFTPPYPMTSDELESANLGAETLQITVTEGKKTLEELVQALPK